MVPHTPNHRKLVIVLFVFAIMTSGFGVVSVLGASNYSIELTPQIDTPNRVVTFESDDYEITAIGRIDENETIAVDTSAPQEQYFIYVYDSDKRIVYSRQRTGDASVQFDMTGLGVGTFLVVIEHDGSFQVLKPFVIQTHHVSFTAPNNGEPDSSITVEATVNRVADGKNISEVKAILGNSSTDIREPMTEVSDGAYETTMSLNELSPGDYSLYVVVQGTKIVYGNNELIGLSESSTFSVTQPTPTSTQSPTPTPTPTEESSSGGGSAGGAGGGGGGATQSETPDSTTTGSPEQTTTESTTSIGPSTSAVSETQSRTEATPPTQQKTSDVTTSITTTSNVNTVTDTSETPESRPTNVITPGSTEGVTESGSGETETPGQPVGILPLIGTITALVILASRRRQ